MFKSHRLYVVLSVIALAALLWRFAINSDSAKKDKPSSSPSSPEEVTTSSAGEGLNRLAKALSGAAATTLGLAKISGRVSDSQSHQGIPNAEVIFSGPSGESSVASDERGLYSIELEPGFYRSYARAEGHIAVAYSGFARLPGPVSAADVMAPREGIAPLLGVFRNLQNVNLSLAPAGRVYGQVRDSDGYAISGAVVAARTSVGQRVISGEDVTESESDGSYELLVPLGSLELEVSHEDYADISPESQDTAYLKRAGQELKVDLTLSKGCIVSGQVIDREGNPILEGAFEREVSDKRYLPVGEIHNGKVRYAGLDLGPVRLRAWPWKNAPSETIEFVCERGARFVDQQFVVPDSEPSLSGSILSPEDKPIPLAYIDLFSLMPNGATQQERADHRGDFAFYDLADGPYQLSVYIPGKGLGLMLIESPSSGVLLTLSGTGSIVGQLESGKSGTMTMGYQCAMRFDQEQEAISDPVSMPMQSLLIPVHEGRFRVDKLPACPLYGNLMMAGETLFFEVEVEKDVDTVLVL